MPKALLSISILLATFAPAGAFAAELTETWTSVRALGMGNAYTAVVSDSDSLFYNPAGLARSNGFAWTIFDPRVGVNGTDAYEAVQEFTDSDDLAQLVNDLYGEPVWAGGGSKTAFRVGGLAFAAFAGADVSGYMSNPAFPVFDLKYFADYGFTGGVGFDLAPGILKFGMAARRTTRVGTSTPIGISTLATLDGDELERRLKNRGSGYGLDMGFLLTLPAPVKPSLSLVWKNIGFTEFSLESGEAAPARIPSEMIVGASVEIDALLVKITPSFDYKYLNDSETQMGKKLHMGIEVSLPLIDLRAGLHQGYYTLGAGVNMGLLRADVATYGVELGEFPGQLEDRRYMAQVSLEIGFDPAKFSFGGSGSGGSGGGGSGRRLKQRR